VAIAFRASTSATPTTGDTVLTIPGSVQAGDLLILAGGLNNGGNTALDWSTPAGWTRKDGRDLGSNLYAALYVRVAQAGDAGTSVTLPTTALGKSGVILAAYSGVDTVTPLDTWAARPEVSSTAAHATPTVTTGLDNDQIVIVGVQSSSATESWSTASGYTKRQDAIDNANTGGHVTATLQDKGPVSVGTYGGESLTAVDVGVKAVCWTLALAEASTTQVSRPVSDVASSGATAVPAEGEGEGLYSRLAGNSDSGYDEVSDGGYVEVAFAALTDPQSDDDHTVTYRAQAAGSAISGTMTVTVKQDSATIATWDDDLTGAFQTFTHTLDPEDAAAITDYSALAIRFSPDVS
jgi:hypothetical protein